MRHLPVCCDIPDSDLSQKAGNQGVVAGMLVEIQHLHPVDADAP